MIQAGLGHDPNRGPSFNSEGGCHYIPETLARGWWLRENAERLAAENGIEIEFLRKRNVRKEDRVKEILNQRGDQPGLVCIFSAMEPCSTYKPWHNKQTGKTYLLPDDGKCLHYYFYFIDQELGLCYVRVPTWLPCQWIRLPVATAHPHHDRRNCQRRGYFGRTGDGAPLPIVVVRNRSRYRGVAPLGAAPERYNDAGSHLGRRRLHVDDREPAPGAVRA